MIKLFLFAALVMGATATAVEDPETRMIQYDDGWQGVASLRIYPAYVHKCSATQISNKFFITTARCVSGFEDKASSMRLVVNSTHLHPDGDANFLEVQDVFINPKYKEQPEQYNFALLHVPKFDMKLDTPDLNFTKDLDLRGYIYSWRFNNEIKDYGLSKIPGIGVLRQPCSEILHRDIGPTLFCVKVTNQALQSGPFDEGCPAISREGVLGGFYGDHKHVVGNRILLYYNIYSVSEWIEEILSKFQEDIETRRRRVRCRARFRVNVYFSFG